MADTRTKIMTGASTLLAIAAIVMSWGFIGQDNIYACLDTKVAMECDRLSAVNSDGYQTRCYFEDLEQNRTRYKSCRSGWLEYKPEIRENRSEVGEVNETVCRLIRSESLVKECISANNDTFLYVVGFS